MNWVTVRKPVDRGERLNEEQYKKEPEGTRGASGFPAHTPALLLRVQLGLKNRDCLGCIPPCAQQPIVGSQISLDDTAAADRVGSPLTMFARMYFSPTF